MAPRLPLRVVAVKETRVVKKGQLGREEITVAPCRETARRRVAPLKTPGLELSRWSIASVLQICTS